jgi:predicted nucleic acid-binding protein
MILYLDTSAVVKRYFKEQGSDQVAEAIAQTSILGTSIICRAEVAAAFAKAVRMGILTKDEAFTHLQTFRKDWPDYLRLELTETAVSRADTLAWEHDLRGYDSVRLACALIWQEAMEESVTLATYDKQLWRVAKRVGLIPFPGDLVEDEN